MLLDLLDSQCNSCGVFVFPHFLLLVLLFVDLQLFVDFQSGGFILYYDLFFYRFVFLVVVFFIWLFIGWAMYVFRIAHFSWPF